MKKLIIILALAMPMLAGAQKYGHVNTQELFQLMPELKMVQGKLDSLNKQYETLLMQMQEEYRTKLQDYQNQQATLPDVIKQSKEDELVSMQERLQATYQTAQQDVDQKQREWIAPIHEKMAKAIQKVGADKGFTYIFDTAATLYVGTDATDVMPDVKKELGIK